jgi:DNA-binding transcriptional LysR family regulator
MRMLAALEHERLDAVFIRPGIEGPQEVQLHRFADEAMKIVVPAGHRLAKKKRVPLAALAQEPFVLFPRAVGLSLYDEVVTACRNAGFEPVLSQEAPQISSVVNLVAAELGVSIVPAAISQVQIAGVCYLDIDGKLPRARLALATRNRESSVIVRNFVDLAKQATATRTARK